jgi:hypothetical protein
MNTHDRATLALTLVGLLVSSCGGDDVVINAVVTPLANRPPSIAFQEPTFDTTSILSRRSTAAVFLVQPADLDGIEDIAAAIMKVDSIAVTAVMFRPREESAYCANAAYVDGDTIDVSRWFTDSPGGAGERILEHYYQPGSTAFVGYLPTPDLQSMGDVFSSYLECYDHDLPVISVHPPAVPAPRDLFVTFMEADFFGITITVYDQSGASVVARYPDLHVRYETFEEERTLP